MRGRLRQNLSVKVDEWLIGRGCIELNPNTLRHSSDSCAIKMMETTKRTGYVNATEARARDFDLACAIKG